MLGLSRRSLALLLPVVLLAGCSSEDEFTANMAGTYTLALTNGASSCPFDDWEAGKKTTGVGFIVTQEGENLHGAIDGVAAAFFALAFGSAEFDGDIRRNHFELTNYGSRTANMGDCAYTYNATVTGDLAADAISGTITYAPATNGNPDCAAVECSASQEFSGSRPPAAK
jgi:hypothetical protein